ncbi:SulP family inorganic anion transporter [Gordonia sp. PKS22-38]|uniref:SulP family inorganic anion transporter n=1 Tax=Gordonia prachuapensis TaxID=3115651 RepID=A0ABU7MVK0_9ACTN|nr:SulP family inorganic anion transporter [Gordonia sp. PKS22-38]
MAVLTDRLKRPRLRLGRPRPADAVSGLVTALFSIPEGMAYASIGGFNPVNGLYSGMVSTLIGSVFSRTVLMVTTLTSAIALSSKSVLEAADLDPTDVGNIAMLTIAVGAVMLLFGLLKVGAIMDFVSSAVMTGFTLGIAVQIVSGVLKDVTGYNPTSHNTLVKFVDAAAHISQWSVAAVTISLTTVAVWAVFRLVKSIESYAILIALVLVTAISAIIDPDIETVGDIAEIPNSLPPVTVPDLTKLPELMLGAFAIALVALAQAAGISAAVPNPDKSRPSASGDFAAQGAANVIGGFFGSLATGGSLSRTGVAVSAGAQTRWAGIFAGAWLLVLVLAVGSVAQIIPMAVIGGLLFVIGFELIAGRWDDVLLVWRSAPLSAVAMVVTFVATTQIPLQNAILVGAAISLVLYCVQAARSAELISLVRTSEGWHTADPPAELVSDSVTVLHYSGVSLFAEVPRISGEWPRVAERATRCVLILSVRTLPGVPSATVQKLLMRQADILRESGGRLIIAGVPPDLRQRMQRAGLLDDIGADNVFLATGVLFESLEKAYTEAERWVVEQKQR